MRLVDFGRLDALQGAPGRSFWHPGAPFGTLQALPGHPRDTARRSRDAPEMPPEHFWEAWGVPKGFQNRFSCDFRCLGTFPRADFHPIFAPISASLLQASWPANGMPVECQIYCQTHIVEQKFSTSQTNMHTLRSKSSTTQQQECQGAPAASWATLASGS